MEVTRYEKCKAQHICYGCEKPTGLKTNGKHYLYCDECREKQRKKVLARKKEHKCLACGDPVEPDANGKYPTKCARCVKRQQQNWRKWDTSHTYNRYLELAGSHKCEGCGVNVSAEFNFCPWCGAEQPEEE